MVDFGFNFVFTLTTLHFLSQALLMQIIVFMGMVQKPRLPIRDNLMASACGVAAIVFMNYNLKFNSVGFYQVTKLMCVPLMVFIENAFYGKLFSRQIKFSLALILVGVGITAVTDIQVNLIGLAFGALAVICTTQFQIWQGAKQTEYQITPVQVIQSVSLPMAIICGTCAIVFEGFLTEKSVFQHRFQSWSDIGMIFLSCSLAISSNICGVTLIGRSSAVTFQVIGHLKTVLILLLGYILFGFNGSSSQLLWSLVGIAFAMMGVILYGHFKTIKQDNSADCLSLFFPFCCAEIAGDLIESHQLSADHAKCAFNQDEEA